MKRVLIIIGTVLALLALAAGTWFWNNMNYDRNTGRKLQAAGFVERQFTLPNGTVLNYGEGPDNGPPLLLIHGQQSTWRT